MCSAQEEAQPDLTKGGKVPEAPSWVDPFALGPTGAFGWMWTKPRGRGRSTTTDGSTQILIAKVADGSPASRCLKEGDVILGVVSPQPPSPGGMFAKDCRKELAASITEAEKTENGGKLVLRVWRGGKTLDAQLKLKVMGSYSPTAPANCKKTEKIIKEACEHIEKKGIGGGIPGHLKALGLLATGEKQYVSLVRNHAEGMCRKSREVKAAGSTWFRGYENLFLTEYYLATKDSSALSAIKALSTSIAMGQSAVGTWGHGAASPTENNGKLHGILGGYGAMNQAALPGLISLALAQKCGVNNDEISMALAKGVNFFRWYVDKGSVPYGDHAPAGGSAANGKNGSAAVLFNVIGDEQSATYFSRVVISSYNGREAGHTGNAFSFIWGGLAAGCTGEEALAAFMREMRWYQELQRRWEGNYHYQPEFNYNQEHGKYQKWDLTGARLLHYCLPRKKLYITGRGGNAGRLLTGKEVEDTIAAGRGDINTDCSTRELLDHLSSWSPMVRKAAAVALSRKEEVTSKMIRMLDSRDRYTRYGACEGLSCAGRSSKEAADRLVKLAASAPDQTLRYYAFSAFQSPEKCWKWGADRAALWGASRHAGPDLLKLAAGDSLCAQNKCALANVLFYAGSADVMSVYPKGMWMEDVDRKVLIPAVRSLLKAQNGGARSTVAGAVLPRLTDSELKQLWGDIYVAAKERAPSGVMFSDGVRITCVRLMAQHGIKEGIQVGLDMIKEDRWGRSGRIPGGINALSYYEGAIKDQLAELKQIAGDKAGSLQEAFARIESGKPKKLISIAAQIGEAEERAAQVHAALEKALSGTIVARAGASGPASPAAKPAPEPEPVIREARKLAPGKMAALNKATLRTLVELSDAKALKPIALGISKTKAKVWLAKAQSDGTLTFQVVGGEKTADLQWDDLAPEDHGTLAQLIAVIKPESPGAQALVGVYLESFGKVQEADKFYSKAGDEARQKFDKLFE